MSWRVEVTLRGDRYTGRCRNCVTGVISIAEWRNFNMCFMLSICET